MAWCGCIYAIAANWRQFAATPTARLHIGPGQSGSAAMPAQRGFCMTTDINPIPARLAALNTASTAELKA